MDIKIRHKQLVQFVFASDDGSQPDAIIYAVITSGATPVDYAEIEDAISSYIDAVLDDVSVGYGYYKLVNDVLSSFNFDYEIYTPSYTFLI